MRRAACPLALFELNTSCNHFPFPKSDSSASSLRRQIRSGRGKKGAEGAGEERWVGPLGIRITAPWPVFQQPALITLNNISRNIRTRSFSLSLPIYHSLSLPRLLRLSLFTTTNILLINLAQILSIHTSLPPAAVTLLSSFWSPFCLISPFFYRFSLPFLPPS